MFFHNTNKDEFLYLIGFFLNLFINDNAVLTIKGVLDYK